MKVKICGITHPEDARIATNLGASHIGIIFSSFSKRKVSLSQAKEIACAARTTGSLPVGIFVDEPATAIKQMCDETGINIIQLHGLKSQQQLAHLSQYQVFYTIFTQLNGNYTCPLPDDNVTLLFDKESHYRHIALPFNWHKFLPPNRPWILAGSLNCDNIELAIKTLNPTMIDIASGVEYQCSIRKNPALIEKIMLIVQQTRIS